jgi:hypothetical protein
MKNIILIALVTMLAGCAIIRYADGERVAIEHEQTDPAELQPKADQACLQSGGKAPAKLVSNLSVNPSLPDGMARKVATFRCS